MKKILLFLCALLLVPTHNLCAAQAPAAEKRQEAASNQDWLKPKARPKRTWQKVALGALLVLGTAYALHASTGGTLLPNGATGSGTAGGTGTGGNADGAGGNVITDPGIEQLRENLARGTTQPALTAASILDALKTGDAGKLQAVARGLSSLNRDKVAMLEQELTSDAVRLQIADALSVEKRKGYTDEQCTMLTTLLDVLTVHDRNEKEQSPLEQLAQKACEAEAAGSTALPVSNEQEGLSDALFNFCGTPCTGGEQ